MTNAPRSPIDSLYHTQRWRNLRNAHIKAHPLCSRCESLGRVRAAACVDHHPPHGGSVERFWRGPFRSLCNACHGRVRADQRRGYENRFNPDGSPADPRHPCYGDGESRPGGIE
jgi:5-methylcytosine-specific restriction protein A